MPACSRTFEAHDSRDTPRKIPTSSTRSMTGPAVDVNGLTKRFRSRTAVDDLTLFIPAGTIAGFIGPNGAGKTTTLRMLLGLIRPTSGEGMDLGEPIGRPERYLSNVGALIESPAFYPSLSGHRNLTALAVLGGHDTRRVDAVLQQVGLADRGQDAYRTYSLGMKQRLGIAAALLADPLLLILDEPTNGLDPAGIRDMRDLLRAVAGDGRTILVSSHLLAELEHVADWLIIVAHGRSVYQGPARDFMATSSRSVLLRPEHLDQIGALGSLIERQDLAVQREGDRLRLTLPEEGDSTQETDQLLARLVRTAFQHEMVLVEIERVHATLEERYQTLVEEAAPGREPGR